MWAFLIPKSWIKIQTLKEKVGGPPKEARENDLWLLIKSFCKDCGSAVPSLQMGGSLLATPAGSLDSELDVIPNGHIFYSNKAGWEKELEKIRKFEKYPE